MATYKFKQKDTFPPIQETLTRSDGTVVNLTGSYIRFTMSTDYGKLLLTGNATIVNANTGQVKYEWQENDLSYPGGCYGEFEVTYPNGSVETFPNNTYIKIKVLPDLDYRTPIDSTPVGVELKTAIDAARTATEQAQAVIEVQAQVSNTAIAVDVATQSAIDAANSALLYANTAQSWAESPTSPIPGSKSAKTWASEAQASADRINLGDFDAKVSQVNTQATQVATDKVAVEADRILTQAARDSTFVNGGRVATTVTAGLALSTDGQQFAVVEGEYIQVYTRTNSTTATIVTGARYPASTLVNRGISNGRRDGAAVVDTFLDLSRQTASRSNGSALSGFTPTVVSNGLQIVSNQPGRQVVVTTDYETRAMEQRITVTGTVTTINTSTILIGIAFGAAGSTRRHYFYRSDGQVLTTLDDETLSLQQAPALAARAYGNGQTVSISVLRRENGTGRLTITLPSGSTEGYNLTGIPSGPIWLAWRGDATVVINSMSQELQSRLVAENIAVAATPELTTQQKLDLFAFKEFARTVAVRDPSGFTGLTRFFNVYRRGDRTFYTDFDFDVYRPFAASAADTTLYVDVATGSDSNPGTAALPLKSIYQAVHARSGNVQVYVRPGVYAGNDSWRDANPTSTRLVVEPWPGFSGRIISRRSATGLTWTLNTGSTYQATVASAGSVVDAANIDANGDFTRLTLRTSIALVDANPGSYFFSGGIVYVRTFDSRAPDSNLHVFLDARNGRYQQDGGTVWLKGIDFEGGSRPLQQACLTAGQFNTGYFWDCSMKYSGGTSGLNGFNTDGRCFSYLKSCIAASNWSDGFNYHNFSGGLPTVSVEIDCIGRNNGFSGAGINNGSTTHDGGTAVRINGQYFGNENRQVHDVNSSYSWNLGCTARDSRGSTARVNFAAGTGTGDSTIMWLDQCTSTGSDNDYETTTTSQIRRFDSVDTNRLVAGSSVVSYTP